MARTGGYRRSGSVTPHAALQNKSIVCSGSRVTNSTVMKLRGSVNRGGIVETYTKSTCSHWYSAVKETKTIPRADGHGLHTVNGKMGGILDRLFFFMPQDLVEIQVEQPQNEDNYEEYTELEDPHILTIFVFCFFVLFWSPFSSTHQNSKPHLRIGCIFSFSRVVVMALNYIHVITVKDAWVLSVTEAMSAVLRFVLFWQRIWWKSKGFSHQSK